MHKRGICHRDVKAENILLSEPGSLKRIKLISFSNATQVPGDYRMGTPQSIRVSGMTRRVGTMLYIAPEVLVGDYGLQCDMWSVGVLAYITLSGKLPFIGKDDH